MSPRIINEGSSVENLIQRMIAIERGRESGRDRGGEKREGEEGKGRERGRKERKREREEREERAGRGVDEVQGEMIG